MSPDQMFQKIRQLQRENEYLKPQAPARDLISGALRITGSGT